jgi:hypothetical protein
LKKQPRPTRLPVPILAKIADLYHPYMDEAAIKKK